jgi:hypothetical protein
VLSTVRLLHAALLRGVGLIRAQKCLASQTEGVQCKVEAHSC